MSNKKKSVNKKTKKERRHGRSTAEWTSLVISIAVIVFVIGAISYSYLNKSDLPASISVEIQKDKAEKFSGEYYLPVEVKNEGSSVAENVRVTVVHTVDEKTEKATFTIHFLPGKASQKAFVAVKRNPSTGTLGIDVESYLRP